MKKLAVFGTGEVGAEVFSAIGKEYIRCFIDSNPKSNLFLGLPCLTFDEFLKIKDETIIIVASYFAYRNEMCSQLAGNGILNYHIYQKHSFAMLESTRPIYYSIKNEEWVHYSFFKIIKNYELSKYNNITLYSYPEIIEILMCIFEMMRIDDKIIRVVAHTTAGIEKPLWSEIEAQSDCIILAVRRNESHFHNKIEFESEKYACGDLAVADFYNFEKFIEEFHHPELEQFKDNHKGERCFIIGNGPSLRMSDLDKLYENNEICFASNKIFYAFEDTNWRPDYYVISDPLATKHNFLDVVQLPAKAKFISDQISDFWNNYNSENCFRYHIAFYPCEPNLPDFSFDITKCSSSSGTVIYNAIQIAVYMGFSEIILLGVDCDYSGDTRKGENHFTNKYVDNKAEFLPHNVLSMQLSYKTAELVSHRNYFRIYNATRGGKVEAFERVNFDDIFNSV